MTAIHCGKCSFLLALFVAGLACRAGEGLAPDVTQTNWRLVTVVSGATVAVDTGRYGATLAFRPADQKYPDPHITGFAFCNGYLATYTATGDHQLRITKLWSTLIGCLPVLKTGADTLFYRVLMTVDHYEEAPGSLTLFTARGDSLRFEAH